MFMGASTLSFRDTVDPPTLEALAIKEALALTEDLYLRRIQVTSDCKVVEHELSKDNSSAYGAVIHEIMDHSSSFDFCSFSHEFRSSNFEAHNVAKHALSLGGGRHIWLGHPGNLKVPMAMEKK
ncbi:putative cysteine-rich receptor-like protein kinase 20 [Hordeum vulgare]|nr:putative cysteine-rich receptor-like protein kinase 20 [Hordeum vulgare]